MKRLSGVHKLLLVVASLLTLSACSDGQVRYYSYRPLPAHGWQATDTLSFHASIPDSMTTLRLSIGIRHRTDYPYTQLPLVLSRFDADSLHTGADTLLLSLTNDKGEWLGEGLSGLYQYMQEVEQLEVKQAGTYHFCLHHAATGDTLHGVSDIGIKLQTMFTPGIQPQEDK